MLFTHRNQVTLLKTGAEFFPALLEAIDAAQRFVWLETYILRADETGDRITAALMQAAGRGVQVNLLLDGFGSFDLPLGLQQTLTDAGVRLLFFRPERSRWRLARQRLRRLHRKLATVDGEIAFVGGINILNDSDTPEEPPRLDYAVALRGPVCAEVAATLRHMWQRECWLQFRTAWRTLPRVPVPPDAGELSAMFLIRDNLRHRRAIESAYLEAIDDAKREIILANAYFFPGLRFRHALLRAAERGVKVVLLLPGKLDQPLMQLACRALFGRLLRAGVEIHEYRPGYLHAKVGVIDQFWATVGSSNIDPFSVLLAREANVVVKNALFARELRDDLLGRLAHDAVQIDEAMLRRARWGYRIVPWLAYQLVRAMIGLTGYGREEYRE